MCGLFGRECIDQCEKTGALKESSVKHCKASSDSFPSDEPWYKQEPLYVQWKEWNCKSECRYQCMMQRENERGELGLGPVKYHGKWLFKRASVFQVPLFFNTCCLIFGYTNQLISSEVFNKPWSKNNDSKKLITIDSRILAHKWRVWFTTGIWIRL